MAGRPREFDRDEALTRIQATFWKHGYEGASMADLVDATGLASARLYAAFGSKEAMFRAAIERYERGEGGFADRALAEEPTARQAVERMLREAVEVYTAPHPRGCMVVSAAATYSAANDQVRDWLEGHRRDRTDSIIERLREAVADGEVPPDTDVAALGDAVAALLHGLSVQARDGVPRHRLLALVPLVLTLFGPPPIS
jgi:AcrR family transcriptional regulator